MQILETLIEYGASSLDRPFTYLCPDDTPVCAGMRVEVRFGAMPRPIVGFVLRASHTDEGKAQIEARLGFEAIERGLIDAGARLLRGESVELERGGGSITLAGIDDPAFIKSGGSAAERAEAQLSPLGRGGFTVLLAHRPELIDTYAAYADVVLSGHAHGGQVRLPFIGGLYAPGQGLLPEYDAGIYGRGGCALIVSRGLGNSLFPLRVNNRPELVTVELGSAG